MRRTALRDALVARGRRPVVVVTLSAPGRTYRAASEPLSIAYADGDGPLQLDARLLGPVRFAPETDALGQQVSDVLRSARVEMSLPEDIDPATVELDSLHISSALCEIALAWPGEDWSERDVILPRGTISGLEVGMAGEPIRFAAEAAPPPAGAPLIDPARDMGTDFPSSNSWTSLDGRAWPLILGKCYGIPAFKIGDIDPDLLVTVYAIAISGHHCVSTSTSDYTLYEDGSVYTPAGTLAVVNTADSEGGPICYIKSTHTDDFAAPTGAFTIDTLGGGAAGVLEQGAAFRAEGIVAWLLSKSGHAIDWKACRQALDRLRGWGMGLYCDAVNTESLAVLRERILRWVPVVEVQARDGIGLRYVDPFTDPPEVDLVWGSHVVDRVGGLVQLSDPDDCRNSFTLEYAYDHYVGAYTKRITIGKTESARCALSHQRFGERAWTGQCNTIWQDATAAQACRWLANRLSLPRFGRRYILDPSMYWIEGLTVARLVDPALGASARRAYVRQRNALMDPLEVLVEIVSPAGGVVWP